MLVCKQTAGVAPSATSRAIASYPHHEVIAIAALRAILNVHEVGRLPFTLPLARALSDQLSRVGGFLGNANENHHPIRTRNAQ